MCLPLLPLLWEHHRCTFYLERAVPTQRAIQDFQVAYPQKQAVKKWVGFNTRDSKPQKLVCVSHAPIRVLKTARVKRLSKTKPFCYRGREELEHLSIIHENHFKASRLSPLPSITWTFTFDVNILVCQDWTKDWAPNGLQNSPTNGSVVSIPLPSKLPSPASPSRHLEGVKSGRYGQSWRELQSQWV